MTARDWLRGYGIASDLPADFAEMFSPVQCTCGGIYDLGTVEVVQRYADCSVWLTPCCRRQVDDRADTGWVSRRDYYHLGRNGERTDAT